MFFFFFSPRGHLDRWRSKQKEKHAASLVWRYSCRVLQRLIEHCSKRQLAVLLENLMQQVRAVTVSDVARGLRCFVGNGWAKTNCFYIDILYPFAEINICVLKIVLAGFEGNRFHYWKYCHIFSRGVQQMEGPASSCSRLNLFFLEVDGPRLDAAWDIDRCSRRIDRPSI